MRFVIAAGGTGGHLFPGLAVGEVLLERGHEVMVQISEKEIDALATAGRGEFRIEKLSGVGLQGRSPGALLRFVLRFRAGFQQVKTLLAEFRPQAVLGMGGFTSTAPILAGRARKIPTFIHESNAIPGKANKLNGRLAARVLLGFAECARFFPTGKCEVTGTPIRKSLATRLDKTEALAAFALLPERKTLLVMGGSQGARGINTALTAALPRFAGMPLQVIHLAGKQDEETLRESYAKAGIPAFVAAFWKRMEVAYSAADFCIARSGAASLTELAHFALPSVLIPYPFAAEDHQTRNAEIFVQKGAATLLPERGITSDLLAEQVLALIADPGMAQRAAQLSTPLAATRVADVLLAACAPLNSQSSTLN